SINNTGGSGNRRLDKNGFAGQ
uniref:Dart gland peptide n=2 Tax=Cornu aspersum TaxID=6535 RepID=DGP_CORAP|nr:RecName: Full=Dart gland peptide [Cornu aspersum]